MHADELRMAVAKVVALLEKAQIASVVDQYRSAKGSQRAIASTRLRQSAAVLMGHFAELTPAEHQVIKILHLESLGLPNYWLELFNGVSDVKKHQGEIVRLASRVMFASSHLPGLINLVGTVLPTAEMGAPSNASALLSLGQGEAHLCIRLTDAGERASDPDRVARSIDGIDMLYSACASIARKPAADLRLDSVLSKRNGDRDLVFAGERGSISAMYAVIESIPDVLAGLDPEQEIDLDAIVRSLPVFADLNKLASLGTFSKQDLKDIADTMHQGAFLTLESGVIPIDPEDTRLHADAGAQESLAVDNAAASNEQRAVSNEPQSEQDEHYSRYLQEREAMLNAQANPSAPQTGGADSVDGQKQVAIDQSRRNDVDELLKSLGQSRNQ